MQLSWSLREEPLAIEGCWADGAAAQQLRKKLPAGSSLRAVLQGSRLVVLGAEVPWVDQLVYLGRQQLIYLPTLWEPNLPYEWLVARLTKLGPPPWALIPPGQALGLSAATAVP